MSRTDIPRTRTPPEVKWLLNERAALVGEIKPLDIRHSDLSIPLRALQKKQAVLEAKLSKIVDRQAQKAISVAAIDTTIRLIHSAIDPSAGGCVKAWKSKYGNRGALKNYLLQILKEALPGSTITTQVINLVILRFKLTIVSPADRRRLKQTVGRQFHQFRDEGLIEGLHDPVESPTGIWRWRSPPSLADLAALQVQAQVAADDRNPYSDPA